ncbi:hypothetical protein E5288_WYG018846 [Bos mutus]|uniref:Uncharacterized protein n=1 Tax=Bos mutus TaxID=72004 RepID=A0A6B0R2K8_9CETA|nr:hypothetical protein [Bos mutus]
MDPSLAKTAFWTTEKRSEDQALSYTDVSALPSEYTCSLSPYQCYELQRHSDQIPSQNCYLGSYEAHRSEKVSKASLLLLTVLAQEVMNVEVSHQGKSE